MQYDVCNGDADGLCAVVQWRLCTPCEATLVTGLKRDIALLSQVPARSGDEVLVCDLSMRRNMESLRSLLNAGVRVRYFDHHAVDEIPVHPLLDAHVEMDSTTCTSLLVNRELGGKFRAWALVGAFGDNLTGPAERLASTMGYSGIEQRRLRIFGESINYNAYGDSLQDVYIAPAKLYEYLVCYPDPLELLNRHGIGQELEHFRSLDMQRAAALAPTLQNARSCVYVLPDAAWSRRVAGSWVSQLASAQAQRAHAVLRARADGSYVVSVRAPLEAPFGAAALCHSFGGDGRSAAAGIDHLPGRCFKEFIAAFLAMDWNQADPPRVNS